MPAKNTPNKFYSKLIENKNGCLEWSKAIQSDGYGILSYQSKFWLAHRLSWFLSFGEIPENMCVCHKCDNPKCCNKNHLFLGTHAENMNDMKIKGRRKNINSGTKNGRAKLNYEKVKQIKNLLLTTNLTQKEIGLKFNISQCMVSAIKLNKFWIS